MKSIHYDHLQETIYYETMNNGLHVYVLPKPGFQKTHAIFSTQYGSIDNHFCVKGHPPMKTPDGIAHFLEHKMFEEPSGDIFATFASQGASANAFTSFDQTAYLFSSTENVRANLETLLNFVQNPYFTDENVEKEKGIISQEINMYQDNPDWRVYFGLIEAMYQNHPVHIDIAGTVSSIQTITKEMLYTCYHTFYHPTNMILFIAGGVQPEQIMHIVRENQSSKVYKSTPQFTRLFEEEPIQVKQVWRQSVLPVSQPKLLFGFKEPYPGLCGEQLVQHDLTTKLMLDLLLSSSTPLYQKLYEENLISDNFGYEYNCSSHYAFSIIGGDTRAPEQLIDRLQEEIDTIKQYGFDEASFERVRNKKIGGYLRMLNSVESIAYEFVRYHCKGAHFFNIFSVYESITLEDVNRRLIEHIDWDQMAVSLVVGPA